MEKAKLVLLIFQSTRKPLPVSYLDSPPRHPTGAPVGRPFCLTAHPRFVPFPFLAQPSAGLALHSILSPSPSCFVYVHRSSNTNLSPHLTSTAYCRPLGRSDVSAAASPSLWSSSTTGSPPHVPRSVLLNPSTRLLHFSLNLSFTQHVCSHSPTSFISYSFIHFRIHSYSVISSRYSYPGRRSVYR